jgi:ribosomal protein L11 methyltransferase
MPWIQLRLSANEETSEKYSDWLSACGAQAVTFIDAQDTPIYEPLPGDEVIYWHNTVVMGFILIKVKWLIS